MSPAATLRHGASTMLVSQMMTEEVWTVSKEASLREVWRLMRRKGARRLPVVSADGRLVGLLTKSIVLNAQRGHTLDLGERTASMLMEQEVVTAHPTDAAAEVAQLMLTHKIGCVPIVSPRRRELLGIVTQADFVWAFVRAARRG